MTGSGNAPPRLVGYWDSRPLPGDIARIHGSWKNHSPGEIALYDHASARAFITGRYGQRESAAFDVCAIPAMQSDLFRLLEIHANGGLYLDMSIELLCRPDALLDCAGRLTVYRRWHGGINNGIFAAAPGHPLLARMIDIVLHNIETRPSNNVFEVTGPLVWNRLIGPDGHPQAQVFTHADLAGEIVQFHQDLAHKKDGRHWNDAQKTRSIYADGGQPKE